MLLRVSSAFCLERCILIVGADKVVEFQFFIKCRPIFALVFEAGPRVLPVRPAVGGRIASRLGSELKVSDHIEYGFGQAQVASTLTSSAADYFNTATLFNYGSAASCVFARSSNLSHSRSTAFPASSVFPDLLSVADQLKVDFSANLGGVSSAPARERRALRQETTRTDDESNSSEKRICFAQTDPAK